MKLNVSLCRKWRDLFRDNINIYKGGSINILMKNEMKIKVKCYHCGYEWETASKAIMVTCPSCIRKTVRVVEK